MSELSATINPCGEVPLTLTSTATSNSTINIAGGTGGNYWIGDPPYTTDNTYTLPPQQQWQTTPYFPSTTDLSGINWPNKRVAVGPDGERAEMEADSEAGPLLTEIFNDL